MCACAMCVCDCWYLSNPRNRSQFIRPFPAHTYFEYDASSNPTSLLYLDFFITSIFIMIVALWSLVCAGFNAGGPPAAGSDATDIRHVTTRTL